ncbi:hypothetical protein B0O99DRAFT_636646 [Bisporella sp. PMI_857]|nr:hypothetical protein B0O99DRAFT_636646 [Bisporella sp. PMI_857]
MATFWGMKRGATLVEREEEQIFLPHEERAEEDEGTPFHWTMNQPRSTSPLTSLPVYKNIHLIRRKILATIDNPYTIEQLSSPSINLSIVQPLVDKFYDPHDVSTVYSLLVNRVQFLHERSNHAHHQSVNVTRALLCELVASKVLQRHDVGNSGSETLLLLGKILVADFDPFQGAPDEVTQDNGQSVSWVAGEREGSGMKSTTLELAIISESKSFLSSSACQKVVDAIHKGRVIYTPFSPIDILPDHYKHRPISIYDPRKAPLLNQYRLIVPRTRYILEVCQFGLLLLLYLLVMVNRDGVNFNSYELGFCLYAFGWVLDQFASVLEHGWPVYTQNLWSFLDVIFAFTYGIYLILRICGMTAHNAELSQLALDILTTGAPVLVPRLAFNVMSNNMLIVALREMMADFAILSLLAMWCSAGFLLAMTWLSNGLHSPTTISKWMLWVWFGLDGTGIEKSADFHKVLGPLLMITFAFLGNTLFLTLLVAMLSNDFSTIVANATTEIQYRRAVVTFGGVKSDSIFAYQPPFNIMAVCLLLPLKFMVSPRWFHKINVAAIRTLNAPLLLIICLYEQRYLWKDTKRKEFMPSGRRRLDLRGVSRFSVYSGIRAVFDNEAYESSLQDSLDFSKSSINIDNRFLAVHENYPKGSPRSKITRRRQRSRKPLYVPPHNVSPSFRTRKEFTQRFEVLESSTRRIEDAVRMLCDGLGESRKRGIELEVSTTDRESTKG